MLRSLKVDDPTAKDFMQPKTRADMSPDELRYLDVVVPREEEELQIARYYAKKEREVLLQAAQVGAASDTKKK